MYERKGIICLFIFICFFCNVYSQYPKQKEIDALTKEIEGLKDDSLVVKKYLDLVVLYPDGAKDRLKKLEEGIALAEKMDMKPEMGIFYSDMGWYYFFRDDRENTVKYFSLAVNYCRDIELLVYAYGVLSNTYSWSQEHDQAKLCADKCLEVAETFDVDDESTRQPLIAEAYMFIGDVYRYEGDRETSKKYYMRALAYLDVGKDYFSVLRFMANVHLGDTSLIIPYKYFGYARWLKLIYETSSPRKKQIIVYNLIKAGDTSVITTEQEELKTKELENQRKIVLFTITVISLLIIIAILLVYQVYVNKKANAKLEKANEIKNRLFIILNHDLKQPIASLISYLDLKVSNPDMISEDEVKLLEEKTSRAANQLYTDMENLLLWAKNQMDTFEPDIRQISVNKVFEDVKTFFSYEERVEIRYDIEEGLYLDTDENYLKTIIRNFTQNSINASLNTDEPIVWKAHRDNKKVVMSIENSGKKIEKQFVDLLYDKKGNEVSKRGAGLIIIRTLAKSINCKIEVKTGEEYGTTFYLIFDEK